MKTNGMYFRSNQEEAVDALCDDCEYKSSHDYSPCRLEIWKESRFWKSEIVYNNVMTKIEESLKYFDIARPGDDRLRTALNAVKDEFTSLSRGQAHSRAYCAQFDVYANHKNAALVATCVMNMVAGGYYAASDSQSLLSLIK